jgi:hypothetical protein
MDLTPPSHAAPPTTPGQIVTYASNWPTVIGVISICLGTLGTLANLWAIVAPLFINMAKFTAPGGGPGAQKAMQEMMQLQAIGGGLNFIAAILLLISGIGVVSRRRWGVKLSRTYAWVRIFTSSIAAVLGALAQQRMMASQAGAPAFMGPMMMAFTILFTIGWGWAYPIFLLIWFHRGLIKQETASWA